MKPFALSPVQKKALWGLLGFTLVARLATSALMPLFDHTESRYGEMARKMIETNDWVAPLYNYGFHFWGKPPLSFWLAAISMKLFGVNETAARLPAVFLEIGILGLVWTLAKRMRGADYALLATVVLATMAQFFVVAGTVMTDSTLALCVTLSMVAFWHAMKDEAEGLGRGKWGWLFFAGLGLGLLAKGPLVGVLVFLPIFPWVLFRKAWGRAWKALPWIGGTLLMLAIAAPWYAWAEVVSHKEISARFPGFLEYFLVGEHFYRFTKPGWAGDLYGHAHEVPHGTIWWFWFSAALPWTLAAGYMLLRNLRRDLPGVRLRAKVRSEDDLVVSFGVFGARNFGALWRRDDASGANDGGGFRTYLLAWALAGAVFFTAAGNIIWPYVMPLLPAIALLVVEVWWRFEDTRPRVWQYVAVGALIPAVMLLGGAAISLRPAWFTDKSEKWAVAFYLADRPSPESRFYTWDGRIYSSEFYTGGEATILKEDGFDPAGLEREVGSGAKIEVLSRYFASPVPGYVSINAGDWEKLKEKKPQTAARFAVAKVFEKPDLKECWKRVSSGASPFGLDGALPRCAVSLVLKQAKMAD